MVVKHVEEISFSPVTAGSGTTMQVLISSEEAQNIALRRFIMEPGGRMPLHTNDVEHVQYVLGGRAQVTVGSEVLEVAAGNAVFIPAGVPHSYKSLGNKPFEFLCAVPNAPDTVKVIEIG